MKGLHTAIVTPFNMGPGYEVLEGNLRDLVYQQIRGGVDGLVVLGTTGEASQLDKSERQRVLRTVIPTAHLKRSDRDSTIVTVGVGSSNFKQVIDNVYQAAEEGADNVLLTMQPYIGQRPEEQIEFVDHVRESLNEADKTEEMGIVIYDVSRTAVKILPETLRELLAVDNHRIVGVKAAYEDDEHTKRFVEVADGRVPILSGSDAKTYQWMKDLGVEGLVSVGSNILPASYAAMVNAALQGDMETAAKWEEVLSPLHAATMHAGNPRSTKRLAAIGKGLFDQPNYFGTVRPGLFPVKKEDDLRALVDTVFRYDGFRHDGDLEAMQRVSK